TPPNSATLHTIGKLGLNITGEAGFDIATGNNTALASIQMVGDVTTALVRIDLSTGAAAVIGPLGGGVVRDIAIGRCTVSNGAPATIDFDGEGRTDYAVFRPSTNTWFITPSSDSLFYAPQFGLAGD